MASQLHCLQVNCPGRKVLGPQQGSLHDGNTADPLHLLLPNCVYNMSAGAVLKMIQDAINAYIKSQFNGKLGEKGRLEIYPVLPSPGPNHTWEDVLGNYFSHDAAVGAILAENSDVANFMADPNILPAHKNYIQDRLKKYQGEKGEERSLVGCIHAMIGNEGSIIHSHKSTLSLLEDILEKNQTLTHEERLDVQFTFLGLQPDKSIIKSKVTDLVNKYFGGPGIYTILDIEAVITNVTADTSGTKREKEARKKDMEILRSHLLVNQTSPSPSPSLDPFVPLYLAKLRKELNQNKREHDITVLRPDFKTIVQAEVKTATSNVNRMNQVVEGALQQLRGGQEEMKRVHGHLLDQQWSFFGIIALPNLTSQDRDNICNQKNICGGCKPFILVDNISTELTTLFTNHFTSKLPDEATWRPAYVSLLSRMLSMVAMVPSLPGDRITGTTEPLVGGFTVKDVIKLEKCDIAEVQKMREAGHRGSPVKIMFLNKTQLTIWMKRLVAFLADFGVGKTTLLAAKAMSLASLGDSVGIFFLHEGYNGEDDIEPVMGLWNKKKFSSLSSNITALSLVDLRQFYRSRGGQQELSGIQLVLYYLQHGPIHIEHVFIDEAAMEGGRDNPDETATVQALKRLSDHLPPTSHLWVAYHSQHLVDDNSIAVNRGQLCLELTGHGFTIPSLFHNMRNSDQVARAAAAWQNTTIDSDHAILPPVAPPSLTPPCKSLYIKCKSSAAAAASVLVAGVVRGYHHIQAASNAAAPPVVVLCNRILSDSVRTCLEAEGVPVTTYWTQAERPAMENYMVCPGGVLITGRDTFSGMEAVNVISVDTYRSSWLRATQTLVFINDRNPGKEQKEAFDVVIM